MKKISCILLAIILVSCDYDSPSHTEGKGGSMARFTVQGDYLYAVDHSNLHVFSIANPSSIDRVDHQGVGFGIETIFPKYNYLFLGARNGIHIYSLEDPTKPTRVSFTGHIQTYDPVVVQDSYAYVTLRSGENGWGDNLLQIYDIEIIESPTLVLEMEMENPKGLAILGNRLFICDNGLKVFSVTNGVELELLYSIEVNAIDVIAAEGWLYVVADDGLFQYSYTDDSLELASSLSIPFKEDAK